MSKNTRYFDTLEEAQQYYGGNVVPSTEIALVGDGSYVFVSSDNAQSGNQQYFDASMTNDEIVSTMTYTAYNEGISVGYAQGYEGGYSYGYGEGQENGFYRDIYTVAMSEDDVIAYTSPNGDHADIYVSTIYDNFTYVDDGASSYITWDDIPTYFIPYGSTEQAYMSPKVHLWPLSGTTIDGKDASDWFSEFLDDNGDFIEDFYGEVHPVLHNVSWFRSNGTVPNSIFAAGDTNRQNRLYYENYVGDCMEDPEEITENGIYINNGQAYFDVNVEGGVSLTDSQIDSMAIGNFVSNTFSVINYTNGFDEVTDYDTAAVSAEEFKSAMLSIVNNNADEADIMYVQEYDGSSCTHKTTGFTVLDAGEDNDYDQGSLAWSGTISGGHKIGFNLFLLAIDPDTGDYKTESSKIYFKQTDSQTNNYTYNMIDVNVTSDVTFKFGVSTDPESGDSVVEFTYSITPQ